MPTMLTLSTKTGRNLVRVTNFALVQVLKAAVTRLRALEPELADAEDALEDARDDADQYADDVEDCLERIEDIDEFVREVEAGRVQSVADVPAALREMADERGEEQRLIKMLERARAQHEGRVRVLSAQVAALRKERLALRRTRYEIFCVFKRNGIIDLARRRLAKRQHKTL